VWKVSGDASPDRAPRAAFTPDGRHLVWADAGGLRLADAATGTEVLRLSGPLDPLSGMDMSADGRRVLVCSAHNNGNWIRVWDLPTGVLLHHIAGGTDKLNTSRLSLDGKRVAAGTFRQGTLVWTLPAAPPVVLRPVSPTLSPAEKTPATVVK